jgi:hypothetical protein
MNEENILRDALAFILCQRNFDPSARAIAHKALKEAYGDGILGDDVGGFDILSHQEFERAMESLRHQKPWRQE